MSVENMGNGYVKVGVKQEDLEASIAGLRRLKPILQAQVTRGNGNNTRQAAIDRAEIGKHFDTAINAMLILYSAFEANITAQQGKKSVAEIAQEVIAGVWGNGTERKEKLEAAGYNYAEVQAIVNERAGNKTENKADNKKSIAEITQEIVAGKWGNGSERKQRLEAEGYNYAEVQAAVNNIMGKSEPSKKNVAEIAKEVISGKWGNGSERKQRLEAAGYNYAEVQAKVNEMLR